jgi:hypothetical protein
MIRHELSDDDHCLGREGFVETTALSGFDLGVAIFGRHFCFIAPSSVQGTFQHRQSFASRFSVHCRKAYIRRAVGAGAG